MTGNLDRCYAEKAKTIAEQNLIRIGKSEAEVTNNKQWRSQEFYFGGIRFN